MVGQVGRYDRGLRWWLLTTMQVRCCSMRIGSGFGRVKVKVCEVRVQETRLSLAVMVMVRSSYHSLDGLLNLCRLPQRQISAGVDLTSAVYQAWDLHLESREKIL